MKKLWYMLLPVLLLPGACEMAPLEGANVIGPAGGYVFYDKGSYSDGWRYLEASPQDAGKSVWGPDLERTFSTSGAIGKGKENSELILNISTAAKLCDDFKYGGYDDWFLPSSGELEALYKSNKPALYNENSSYWSSTQDTYSYSYWSSTQDTYSYLYGFFSLSGSNGILKGGSYSHSNEYQVRPIRRF